MREGDDVIVKDSYLIDGLYGLIVKVQLKGNKKLLGRKNFNFPLCDLAALDEQSSYFQFIDDYRTWFANR